jgi:DNA adenine methylase
MNRRGSHVTSGECAACGHRMAIDADGRVKWHSPSGRLTVDGDPCPGSRTTPAATTPPPRSTPAGPTKPPFAYYGGKSRLAPWIVSLLPAHRVYIEPFAGSAAVLLAKARSPHEILNDVDGEVVRFFRVLRDRPAELELACTLTPYARDEFDACSPALAAEDLDDVERARRWWARSSMSFASTGTVATGFSTSIIRGANNARSMANRVARFGAVAERLRHVTIENRDALDVLARYAAPDAVAYLDAPYAGETRTSIRDGRRPGGDYAHEFHTEDQHRALAAAAQAFPGTVLISGYPGPLYDELYSDWTRLERRVVRRASNGRRGVDPKVTEAVWTNRTIPDRLDLGYPTLEVVSA